MTNVTMAVAERAAVEVLIPMASATAAIDMIAVGHRIKGRDPTLCTHVSDVGNHRRVRSVETTCLNQECWNDGEWDLGHDDKERDQARFAIEYWFQDPGGKVHDWPSAQSIAIMQHVEA